MRLISAALLGALIAAGCGAEDAPLRASVSPADIYFDTFDGGSVPLSEASAETIARLLDAITPVDLPTYESVVETSWLGDADVVLSYIAKSGEAFAYPVKILDLHEIVNDEIDGVPVLISYCPLCRSGVAYDRRTEAGVLEFSNTSALYENDMVMVDRQTGSYWWQAAGDAIVGELTGNRLEALPAETVSWDQWRDRHPRGLVLKRPTDRDYSRDRFAGYAERVDAGSTPFRVDPAVFADDRLNAGALVIVVETDEGPIAWTATPPRSTESCRSERCVHVAATGEGGTVTRSGESVPVRTMLWFAALSVYPELTLSAG
jgi:hypothetical protein